MLGGGGRDAIGMREGAFTPDFGGKPGENHRRFHADR
jgi:hypothetical protein